MSDSYALIPEIAQDDLTCFACYQLGIPTPTILADTQFMLKVRPAITENMCMDCYEREFAGILPFADTPEDDEHDESEE